MSQESTLARFARADVSRKWDHVAMREVDDSGDPHRHVHVLTPGDHYSPRTGSAIPTVVHGLAGATPDGTPRPHVLVARGTYPDRYNSAVVDEYVPASMGRVGRYVDGALSRLSIPRVVARRQLAATLAAQREWPPSYVFAHNAPQLVPVVDRSRHTPVLYAHNDVLRTYGPAESYRTLRDVETLVCVSQFLADRMRCHLDARVAPKVRVVHSGVDTDFFRPPDDAPGREANERLEVVFVGRMIPDKGAHILLAALAALDRPDVHATFVGSYGFDSAAPLTPYESALRRQAAAMAPRVDVLPFQPRERVAEILRRADVAVVPSVWEEPAGLTVLEAMASGLATIASDVGGIPELAGDAGILVPPADSRLIAEVLDGLADDPLTLLELKARSRDHAEANTWGRARRDLDAVVGGIGV